MEWTPADNVSGGEAGTWTLGPLGRSHRSWSADSPGRAKGVLGASADTHTLLLWQALDGASLVPQGPPKVKRRARIPDKPNYSLNLWSIMKNCIGRELSKIPMPVGVQARVPRAVSLCVDKK